MARAQIAALANQLAHQNPRHSDMIISVLQHYRAGFWNSTCARQVFQLVKQDLLPIQTPLLDGDITLEDLLLLIHPETKATPKVTFSVIQALTSSSEHTVVVNDGLVRKWFSKPDDADIKDQMGWVFRPVPELITEENQWG